MREAFPDQQVRAEVQRLYKERYGEEPDPMALDAFTFVAQLAYSTAVDLHNWAVIMHDPASQKADENLPCGAEVMARFRGLAEEAMNNVTNQN